MAAPYASELLNLQDARSQSGFLLGQLQQQAADLGQAAAAMPLSVRKIESTIQLLETGDLKLRVRVLEAERAARRAGVIQVSQPSPSRLHASMRLRSAGGCERRGAPWPTFKP